MKRRIFVFYLILVLVFSTLSFTPGMLTNISAADEVAEIDGTQYATLDAALAAVTDGQTIKLLGDITDSDGISITNGRTFTINLDGHILNVTNTGDSAKGLEVKNGSAVSLDDSAMGSELNVSSSTYGVYADDATVTVSSAIASDGTAVIAFNNADVTVTGNAEGTSGGIYATNSSVVTVNGDVECTNSGTVAVSSQSCTIHIFGSVIASGGGSSHGVLGSGDITVDGDVEGSQFGVEVGGFPSVITVGGNVTARGTDDEGAGFFCYGAMTTGGEINIGGNITASGGTGARSTGGGDITIDGMITSAAYVEFAFGLDTIKKAIGDKTIPTTKLGYFTYTDDNGTVWVKETASPVAEIDGTQYTTLDDALNAVPTGGATATTIKILQDIDYTGGITVSNKKIIFDLNDKTLSINNTVNNILGRGLYVTGGSEIDITNPGAFNVTGSTAGLYASNSTVKVTNANGDSSYGVTANGSDITVTNDVTSNAYMGVAASAGSTVSVEGNVSGATYGVYAQDADTDITVAGNVTAAGDNSCGVHSRDGAAVVVHGNVTATGNDSLGANLNGGGTLTVDGIITALTYIQFGIEIWNEDDKEADITNPGYFTYTDGTSTVWVKIVATNVAEISGTQYATLDEALAAVTNGQTIKLLKDASHASKIEAASKSFIIDVNSFKLTVNVSGDNCVSVVNGQSITINDTASGGSFEVNGSGMKDGFGIKGLYVDGNASTITVTVPATINVTGQSNIGVYAGSKGVVDAKFTNINNSAGIGYVYGVIVYEGGTAHVGNIDVAHSGNWCIGVYLYGDVQSHGQTSATVDGAISADEYIRMGPVTVNMANETIPTTKAGYKTYKLDSAANANTVWIKDTSPSPTITGMTLDKTNLPQAGGTVTAAVTGTNLDAAGTVLQVSLDGGVTKTGTVISNNGTNAVIEFDVPENTTATDRTDTVALYLNGTATGHNVTVTVAAGSSNPTVWPVGSVLTASGTTDTSTVLSWTAATGAIDYSIYKNNSFVGGSGGTRTYTVTGLSPNTQYTFKVQAAYVDGGIGKWTTDGPSVIVMTAAAPVPPQTPTISPNGGTFAGSTTVTITSSGGTVYYTTDGSNPTTSSTQYTAPFKLTQSATVKAAVRSNSNVWSGVASARFTITSSPGGNGGDSSGGGGSNSAPVQESNLAAQVLDSNGNVSKTVTVKLDKSTGTAAVNVDSASLTGVFDKSKADGEGVKTVKINIPQIDGAKAYEPVLPASFFTSADAMKAVEIKTSVATVTVPGNMLQAANAAAAQNVSLTIAAVDKSKLPAEVQAQIGSRPVIELNLKIDGSPTSWSNENVPVTVSVPYMPTAEELKDPEHITVWYIDGSGKAVSVPSGRYDPATGKVTFSTTHFSKYAVAFSQKTFNDLGNVVWAKKQIEVLASKGILRGISEKEYAPSTSITRADFLYYLVRTLGVDAKVDGNFEDISSDAYYYKEIGIAKKLRITSGTGNNKFNPDASITRQDMAVLTERALRMLKILKQQGTAMDLEKFSDKSLIAAYAANSVASLVKEGLLIGSSDNINPLGNMTRAEAAVFLYRLYGKN